MSADKVSIREQLKAAFALVDKDKTGVITKAQLTTLLKKLNDFSETDLQLLFDKLGTSGDNVKWVAFLDLFCPEEASKEAPKPAQTTELKRELSKPMSEEESAAVRKVFDQFDKDSSGFIDLAELSAMCTSLDKPISNEQAAAAMQQLDKNGDGKVAFDEFCLWWTCTPGCGGYGHVALKFLKGKLALQSKSNKFFSRVVRKKLTNTDEFDMKANIDITPEKTGTKEQATAKVTMSKKADSEDGPPIIVTKIVAKNPDTAAAIIGAINDVLATPEIAETPLPTMMQVTQEAAKVVITVQVPDEMFDEDAAQAIAFLQDAAKDVKVLVGLGATFEEVLSNPNRPLCQLIKGIRFGADAKVGLSALAGCSKEELPPQLIVGLNVLAGVMIDAKLHYNHTNLLLIAEKFKSITKMEPYADESQKRFSKVMCKGIAYAREIFYEMMDGGPFENGKWADGAPVNTLNMGMKVLKELANGALGIESATLSRLPGATVVMEAKFDKVNPFPMVDYFCGTFPSPPPGYSRKKNDDEGEEAPKKPLSSDEANRLKGVFDKYDKDKSGKIDLTELKAMLEELGAKCDEDEVQEGMTGLDTNGDGTCSFDEFKNWWSSKSSCGGYTPYALSAMRQKMKMQTKIAKWKAGLGGASGYIGLAENTDDTYIKFQQEVTPAMVECQSKMSIAAKLDKSSKTLSGDAKYSPEFKIQFTAKSDADASAAATLFQNDVINSGLISQVYEMLGVTPPTAVANGSTVVITASPPSEMVGQAYESDESAQALQVISVMVNAALGSCATMYMATDYNDVLAHADDGIYATFKGAKLEGLLTCTAAGKTLALDAIKGLAPMTGLQFEQGVAFPVEFAKLFQFLELTYLLGYHKDNLDKAAKYQEEMAQMTSPSSSRELLASFFMPEMFPPEMIEEGKKISATLVTICDKLDSLKEAAVDGVYMPGKVDSLVAVILTASNFKCFDYLKYMTEPLRQKLDAA